MRLWHEKLIPLLPYMQLGGQHRECCALRGNGWGKPHSTVNYVFKYNPVRLYKYHMLIIAEKRRRGHLTYDREWLSPLYRGLNAFPWQLEDLDLTYSVKEGELIYPEHDVQYFKECLVNMVQKGVPMSQFFDENGKIKL